MLWPKMGLIRKCSINQVPSIDEITHQNNEVSEKDIFKSPSLLAEWVNKYFLEELPLEKNYDSLPSEESRKNLNITYEQRERYIREIPILRIAGISLFVKRFYDDEFWLKFSSAIYKYLYHHLYRDEYPNEQLISLANAIEKYVIYSESGDEKETSMHYMHRVYDDSDNFLKLLSGGVGYLSVGWLMDSYEIFRDAYFKVTQGVSYESYKLILESIEQVDEMEK